MPPKKARKLVPLSAQTRSKARQIAEGSRPKLSFLDLPLDIRDMIYGLLLLEPDDISPLLQFNEFTMQDMFIQMLPSHMRPDSRVYCKHLQIYGLQPQVLRVNRQVHDEAARVLYGRNTFVFSDAHRCCPNRSDEMSDLFDPDEEEVIHMQEVQHFKLFLIDIGLENRMLIRKLKLRFCNAETFGRGYVPSHIVKLRRFLGSSFVDGFRMLAQGHGLQSLRVDLEGCTMADEMESRKDLLVSICSVKNIPSLQIESSCSCHEGHIGNKLNAIRLKISQGANSAVYRFPRNESGTIKFDCLGGIRDVKTSEGTAVASLTSKIKKLAKERAVLEARILEDSERRDYITKMLRKAESEISL